MVQDSIKLSIFFFFFKKNIIYKYIKILKILKLYTAQFLSFRVVYYIVNIHVINQ